MEIRMELRLAKFIEYVEAEIRDRFSDEFGEPGHEPEFSHEGAVMMLVYFGLAVLDEDEDGVPMWCSRGCLTSPRALKD
jgi:hypothetical protein